MITQFFFQAMFLNTFTKLHKKSLVELQSSFLSGWQDSNLRPPRPKRGAITGLRYTPKIVIKTKTVKF